MRPNGLGQKMIWRLASSKSPNIIIIPVAMSQDMFDSYTAHNSRALKELVENQGVQIRKLPDEVLKHFYEISQQVYAEQAAKDPQFKKVYDSYSAFMKDSAAYQKI